MGYALSVALTALATALRMWLDPILGDHSPFATYYLAVMFAAWYAGWGPALLAMFSGGLLAAYLFTEPRGSVLIYDLEHQVGIVLYLVVGLVVIVLTESLRRSRRRADAALVELADTVNVLAKEIDERKRAEQETARLASFPMRNPEPVVEVDLDGHVCFANPVAQRLFPDLQQLGPDHPWLSDWDSLANACREPGASLAARDVAVGGPTLPSSDVLRAGDPASPHLRGRHHRAEAGGRNSTADRRGIGPIEQGPGAVRLRGLARPPGAAADGERLRATAPEEVREPTGRRGRPVHRVRRGRHQNGWRP